MKEVVHGLFRCYLRHFPLRQGKERVLKKFWRPLSFGNLRRVGRLKNSPVELDCDLTQWIQRHVYFLGEYEPESCRLWAQLAGRAKVIFDVGANVGIYSLLASSANRTASIHAFEPTPEMFRALSENIRRNSAANIVPHQEAVGATGGAAFLWQHVADNEGMNYVTEARVYDSQPAVNRTSLDEFCRANGIERVDLMKIDIEGGEYDALRGAERLLAQKKIGCLFIELLDPAAEQKGHTTGDIKELLKRAGYHMFAIRRAGLTPIERYGGTVENAAAFAEMPDLRL